MKEKKPQKAGRAPSGSGNVTIDLGEKIEAKLRQTSMAGAKPSSSKLANRPGSYRPGGYRPGMFGGYRPWYASRWNMGEGKTIADRLGFPRETRVSGVLTGTLVGIGVNRALVRLSPMLIKNDSKLLHEGIAFVAGLVPFLVKRQSAMALGVAVPGFIYLGGTLVDALFDYIGWVSPALQGAQRPTQRYDAAMASRQKLAALAQRPQVPVQARPAVAPRVVAQPSFAR